MLSRFSPWSFGKRLFDAFLSEKTAARFFVPDRCIPPLVFSRPRITIIVFRRNRPSHFPAKIDGDSFPNIKSHFPS